MIRPQPLGQVDRLEAFAGLARGLAPDFNNVLMAILGNINLVALAAPSAGEPAPCPAWSRR
jgi:hypothetical protein